VESCDAKEQCQREPETSSCFIGHE
jgi:hypothetical protein